MPRKPKPTVKRQPKPSDYDKLSLGDAAWLAWTRNLTK